MNGVLGLCVAVCVGCWGLYVLTHNAIVPTYTPPRRTHTPQKPCRPSRDSEAIEVEPKGLMAVDVSANMSAGGSCTYGHVVVKLHGLAYGQQPSIRGSYRWAYRWLLRARCIAGTYVSQS